MIGKKCKNIETGMFGIIKSELKGTDEFPDQWGIYWIFSYHKSIPSHYYWNNKNIIVIID